MTSAHGALKCNRCWKKLAAVCYLTECCHLFCESDAKEVELSNNMKKTVIIDIANKAIEFYGYQKDVESEFKISKLMRREEQFTQLDKSFQERILDASNKITLLTHQLDSAKSERDTERKELQDLKEKYAEKSRQKRKIAELYETIKKKHGDTSTSNNLSASPEHDKAPRTSSPAYTRTPSSRGGAPLFNDPRALSSASPSRSFSFQRPDRPALGPERVDRFSMARNATSPRSGATSTSGSVPPQRSPSESPSPRFSFGALERPSRPETPTRTHREQRGSLSAPHSNAATHSIFNGYSTA